MKHLADPDWLKISDVAARLSVSDYQVRKWIQLGQFDELAAFSKRTIRISRASFDRFVDKNRRASA